MHVTEAEPALSVGQRDELAIDPLGILTEVQVADVVGGEGARLGAGDEHSASCHRGKIGRDPAQVLEAHLR